MGNEYYAESLELEMPGGESIRGELHCPVSGQRAPVVVFAHGFGSTRSGEKALAVKAESLRRGWAFGAIDFRSHGESGGTMPELRGSRLIEDLEAVAHALARRGCGPLCLVGSSMGAWAACWFAALRPEGVTACALIAPAFRFLEWRGLGPAEREEWRRTGRRRICNEFVDLELSYELVAESPQYEFESLVGRIQTPLILFQGMQDDIVPYQDSLQFAARCSEPDVELILFKGGDHRLTADKERIARMACDFFAGKTGTGN